MYKTHCDEIVDGDNVIIGLGDSFTQGIGAYSTETWQSISHSASSYNIAGQHFVEEQGKNNWVRQLSNSFLPNYKVHNLGVNGAGNRAAVKELYLNPLPASVGNVIVILMSTGLERFDFVKQSDETAGINWHQKWQTVWPTVSDRGPISRLEKEYFQQIWNERADALEFLFNVADAQNFCDSRGYKFLFTSAFDTRISRSAIIKDLDNKSEHINIANWDNYIAIPGRETFMDMINQLENSSQSMLEIHQKYSQLPMPTRYVTPCSHWTIEGQYNVAEYLFKELTQRQLV